MTVIELHKRFYTIPTCWDELSQKQLLAVIRILYSDRTVEECLLLFLKTLTGISWYQWCRTSIFDKEQYLYLTFFLVNSNNLTRQLLHEYKGFYGPDDDFNNLVGTEFVFAEDFYTRYCETKRQDERLLDGLIAVLYRPKELVYDPRRLSSSLQRAAYNDETFEAHKKKVARWPQTIKLAILRWFEGCREKMMQDNPEIFNGAGGEPAKYGWLSIIRMIAKDGVHGDFDKVADRPIKMIMMELNEMHEEVKRNEKHLK